MEVAASPVDTSNLNHVDDQVSESGRNEKNGTSTTTPVCKEKSEENSPDTNVKINDLSTANRMPSPPPSVKDSERSDIESVNKDTSAPEDETVLTPSSVQKEDIASVSKSEAPSHTAESEVVDDDVKSSVPEPDSSIVAESSVVGSSSVAELPVTATVDIPPDSAGEKPATESQNAAVEDQNLNISSSNALDDALDEKPQVESESAEEIKVSRSESVRHDESDSDALSVGKAEEASQYDDSEYESVEHEETEEDLDKEEVEDEEEEYEDHRSESGQSSAGSHVPTEREEGDGQESEKKDKKLDHDEDKRDPQYIPKKGNFYEHDDRTSETDEPPEPRKKVPPPKSYEGKERWNHDMYNEDLQSPKSRQELIDQYGYDIRQEEGPPKARRRRRYGRGPNKYTRSWEEVEAYAKVKGLWRPRGGRHGGNATPRNTEEEFPPLPAKKLSVQERLGKRAEKKEEKPQEEMPKEIERDEPQPKTPPPRRREREEQPQISRKKESPKDDVKKEATGPPSGKKTFRQVYAEEHMHVMPSRGRGRGRGRFPAGGTPSFKQPMSSHHQQLRKKNSTAEEDIATLSQHFSEAVINVDNKSIMPITQQQQQQQTRASSLPPTASGPGTTTAPTPQPSSHHPHEHTPPSSSDHRESEKSEGKSKRYSTQRQRSLPTGQQPMHQQQVQPPPQGPPAQRFIPPAEQFFHQGLEGNPAVPGPPPPAQFAQPPPPGPFPSEVPMMTFIPPGSQFPPLYVPPPPYLPPAPLPVQVSVCPQEMVFNSSYQQIIGYYQPDDLSANPQPHEH